LELRSAAGAEQLILKRLAVFRGDFTMHAATAVATDDRIKTTDVLEGVANLATKSLVATDIGRELTFHRLLDTTRAYALEKLTQSGELERVARRHAEFYRDLFERAEAELEAQTSNDWLAIYSRRIDNLRAALDWSLSPNGDASIGVALTAAAVPLWMHLSLMDECRSRVERALAALAAGPGPDARREMQLHSALGASLIYTRGGVPEFSAAWTKAFEIAESLDDAEYRLQSLWGLWFSHLFSGQHRIALALAQRFCTLAGNPSDPHDRLVGERLIGVTQHYLGDQTSARRHLERMLAHYSAAHRSHIDAFQIDERVSARTFISRILWLQGFPEHAMRAAESSIEDARAANHAMSLCYALAFAACPIALWTGDLMAAESHIETLLDHSTRHALAVWYAHAAAIRVFSP
jgi:predicted ATPase